MRGLPAVDRRYCPEIDGLRALAVLVVVLFHFDVAGFSGGYVGVDVFFVISGYLITRNILVDYAAGNWSFSRFYLRRFRRLFPALFVTMLVTLVFACLLFSPQHLTRLGLSLLTALVSLSNIFFWSESGYFDTSEHFKPLLHTWSLSVEEQFYLIWSVALFFFLKLKNKQFVPLAFLFLSLLSLILSHYWIEIDASAAFYLIQFRIFEFATGAILLWLLQYKIRNVILLEIMFIAGVSLILLAVIVFDKTTPFPGMYALMPCLGATLIIYAYQAKYAGILLRNRPMVAIGLISYSVYLVHWPLLVMYKYWKFVELTTIDILVLLATTFIAAFLLYRYVELPCRYPTSSPVINATRRYSNKVIVTGIVAFSAVISVAAVDIWKGDGWAWRFTNYNMFLDVGNKVKETDLQTWSKGDCYLGGSWGKSERFPDDYNVDKCLVIDKKKTNIFILGDSIAATLVYGLKKEFPDINFLQLTVASCRPWVGKKYRLYACEDAMNYAYNFIHKNIEDIDWVLISGRWYGKKSHTDMLFRTINATGLPREKLILFGDFPQYSFGAESILLRLKYDYSIENITSNFERYRINYAESNRYQKAALKSVSRFIEPHDLLCHNNVCDIVQHSGERYKLFTRDGNHLTPDGSIYFAKKIRSLQIF